MKKTVIIHDAILITIIVILLLMLRENHANPEGLLLKKYYSLRKPNTPLTEWLKVDFQTDKDGYPVASGAQGEGDIILPQDFYLEINVMERTWTLKKNHTPYHHFDLRFKREMAVYGNTVYATFYEEIEKPDGRGFTSVDHYFKIALFGNRVEVTRIESNSFAQMLKDEGIEKPFLPYIIENPLYFPVR